MRHLEMMVHLCTFLWLKLTYPPTDGATTYSGLRQLVSVNQMEFTIEAQPTRCGHLCQTRDMMEVMACLCSNSVDSEVRNSNTAIQCGYRGCETLWVSVSPLH